MDFGDLTIRRYKDPYAPCLIGPERCKLYLVRLKIDQTYDDGITEW